MYVFLINFEAWASRSAPTVIHTQPCLESRSRRAQDFDFTVDALAELGFGDFEVIADLQAQPDRGAGAEVARQAHGGIDRDGSLAMNDLADANRRNAKIVCQAILAQAERFHEVFQQNFAGMDGGEQVIHKFLPLGMIVHNFHVSGFVINPLEANSPLVINTDAILPCPVILKLFQLVSGWGQQILEIISIIEIDQFAPSGALNIFWQLRGNFAKKDFLCFIGSKGLDHNAIVSRRDNIFKTLFFDGRCEKYRRVSS
jgi:hypothetical protein